MNCVTKQLLRLPKALNDIFKLDLCGMENVRRELDNFFGYKFRRKIDNKFATNGKTQKKILRRCDKNKNQIYYSQLTCVS